jgi:tRNA U54 and U55 pseudouridine synthase Pus10
MLLKDFKDVCRVLAVYTVNSVTPMQVITRLRDLKKMREVHILSNAFEHMPGYSMYLIQEFIDLLRMKVVVQ